MKALLRALILFTFLTAPAFAATGPALPNTAFTNENGKTFHLNDLKGNYLFISFVYSRCPMPKMCPLTITLNKQLLTLWKKQKPSLPLKLLVVTLDPEHDTPAVLKQFKKSRGLDPAHFVMATGNPATLSDFASNFNVLGIPSEGMISHNVKSVLVGPDLVPIKEYKENEWDPKDVVKDASVKH